MSFAVPSVYVHLLYTTSVYVHLLYTTSVYVHISLLYTTRHRTAVKSSVLPSIDTFNEVCCNVMWHCTRESLLQVVVFASESCSLVLCHVMCGHWTFRPSETLYQTCWPWSWSWQRMTGLCRRGISSTPTYQTDNSRYTSVYCLCESMVSLTLTHRPSKQTTQDSRQLSTSFVNLMLMDDLFTHRLHCIWKFPRYSQAFTALTGFFIRLEARLPRFRRILDSLYSAFWWCSHSAITSPPNLDEIWSTLSTLSGAGPGRFWAQSTQ